LPACISAAGSYFQARKHAVDPPAGGADAFLDFIESEVKPFINEHYRTETDDETLAGYSLGGVFGFHVLFNHTDTFDKYIIGSPSIWWDDEVCFDFEAKYAKNNKDLAKRVFISVGSLEPGGATNHEEMLRRLKSREYANLKVEHFVFPGETHVSGLGTAFNRGLKFVFNDKPPSENNMP
jgi:predicted alpha/beta superfamily hydrolase